MSENPLSIVEISQSRASPSANNEFPTWHLGPHSKGTSRLEAMPTALITGGTSGIGLAFARELAQRGHDLVIVGRSEASLAEICTQLANEHDVTVEPLVADLAHLDQIERVQARVESADQPIDVLVNCAGFAVNSKLADPDDDRKLAAMNVMVNSVMLLSSSAARSMLTRDKGMIINVGSASAWIIKGNYSAIKSWVVTYTQALAAELDGTGVQATVVIPGWVKTDWHQKAGVKRPKLPNWMWIEPDEVVSAALDAAERGKPVAIPTRIWRLIIPLVKHAPSSLTRTFSKRLIRSREAK